MLHSDTLTLTVNNLEQFQWAPTLGGECYKFRQWAKKNDVESAFQWAPTLGGECYPYEMLRRGEIK